MTINDPSKEKATETPKKSSEGSIGLTLQTTQAKPTTLLLHLLFPIKGNSHQTEKGRMLGKKWKPKKY